ncbi:MAG: quinohemoprotein amine dehydrogenase subunit alpha [Gemmatimonadetes bacterium]|nr:quinohemoprotein amine dehydrogenase subunit alpha [Gemmatimonadota bacterium]MDA1102359.1 quinohemoprotein amine dehydrogenase subunit alpha [Gemmatimonadota bacterium]
MASPHRALFSIVTFAAGSVLLAWSPAPQEAPEGYAIANEKVIDRCSRCHVVDDDGRMSRISYLRKTPEGWQTSIRRMMALHGARLNQADATEIVRYLANEQGLAPEELRPGMFEVERRSLDHDYEGDSGVEYTCIQCHSMGRVITQRRTGEEWSLLLATHRGLYPLVDRQAFRNGGRGGPDSGPHPMDEAIDHLSEVFPLETPEWSAWSATKRSPRLAGTWTLAGHEPGKGPIFGTVTIIADPGDPDAFTTSTAYVYAESGQRVQRTGRSAIYTGFQWRGRSNPGAEDELREVMLVERGQSEISGRWFRGDYDEVGPDVTLRRVSGGAVVSGVYPMALEKGVATDVQVFGLGLTSSSELDFGAGITVESTNAGTDGSLRVRVSVMANANLGARDVYSNGSIAERAVVVHDGVDRIGITPETGLARAGGVVHPKGYQAFDAIGYDNGPDGEPNTDDDLNLGRVAVSWHLEEYAATFGDDDIDFVGHIGTDGVFVPAVDGPNPERSGLRNNIGDVWVVATLGDGGALSARAHLVVAPPLYMRWEPWREIESGRPPIGDER